MFDTIVKNALVATASDKVYADLGITNGKIEAIGRDLQGAATIIDASRMIITPGGVDSHCHIEQKSALGLTNADTFETATRAAAAGGTTSVICFAAQHVGMSLRQVVDDYHLAAKRGAIVDYAFHMILADPRQEILENELPGLVDEGHTSLKCFLTYDGLRVDDHQLLNVLFAARKNGCMVCLHAENHALIQWISKKLLEQEAFAPKFHPISHPRLAEEEAISRVINLAAFADQPIMIFHVSTKEGLERIAQARLRGQKVFAETCTQYLTLTADAMDKPGLEGAMWMCSPPLREKADQEALWQGLSTGVLDTVSSDHAPYRMDETGKLAKGPNANFKQIANGMGGLQWRMPVLFHEMISKNRMDLCDFVNLTATRPAKIYDLYPRKGSIAVGCDADIVIWDPDAQQTVTHKSAKDNTSYSAYDGMVLKGVPYLVMRRGEIIADQGDIRGEPGSGNFLSRKKSGEAAKPSNNLPKELDPQYNHEISMI